MTSNDAMRPIGLGTFADYINISGADRMRLIAQQRSLYSNRDHDRYPPPYAAAVSGIKKAVRDDDPTILRQMVFRATTVMLSHYEELAESMRDFMERRRPEFIETRPATWSYGPLMLSVNQHVGMKLSGEPYIVFPYLKQPPLTTDGAKVLWRTLEHTQDVVLPDSNVAVLDVRRGKLFKPTRVNRPRLDGWIESEAVGYVEHWRRAA